METTLVVSDKDETSLFLEKIHSNFFSFSSDRQIQLYDDVCPAERKAHMDEFQPPPQPQLDSKTPPALKESVGLRASYTETEASAYKCRSRCSLMLNEMKVVPSGNPIESSDLS